MKKIFLLTTVLIVVMFVPGLAQQPAPTPPPSEQNPGDDGIVRISTSLIQVDASVVDKKGKPVTDLRSEDFEILVNGKPQKVSTFSFVGTEPSVPPARNAANKSPASPSLPSGPVLPLRPDEVKRTIAVVIDDLSMSPTSISYTRSALKKFVDNQMEPGDLVAIVLVGRGVGAIQQFTSDKRLLYSIIDHIQYNLNANKAVSAMMATVNADDPTAGSMPADGPGIVKGEDLEGLNNSILVNASLAGTDFVVRGMRNLPGRKAVLLLSEGFALHNRQHPEYDARLRDAVKQLVDDAARSAVVISDMDTSGLVIDGTLAFDAVTPGANSQQISQAVQGQSGSMLDSQEGLKYLAAQTGGLAIINSNDLSSGIRQALNDLRSYYQIGFQPDASLLEQKGRRFNELSVKVNRPNLKVRYRSGFFGIKDQPAQQIANNPGQQMLGALTSPFGATDISLRLTPLFTVDAKAKPLVRSFVHISTKDLTFVDLPQGSHQAVINIVAFTFDLNGGVVDSGGETHTISLTDELYRRALASGFVYSLNVPIKKAGAYQLRVAVRDVKSSKLGSASQFIAIPDLKKNRLALSGIALSSYDPTIKQKPGDNPNSASDSSGNDLLTQASQRRFHSGSVLQFAYGIYNTTIDQHVTRPSLVTSIKLYRDGKEIYAGKEVPFDATGQTDFAHLLAQGSLQLGGVAAGDYVLQVIVTDIYGKLKYKTATTWMDFEVVK